MNREHSKRFLQEGCWLSRYRVISYNPPLEVQLSVPATANVSVQISLLAIMYFLPSVLLFCFEICRLAFFPPRLCLISYKLTCTWLWLKLPINLCFKPPESFKLCLSKFTFLIWEKNLVGDFCCFMYSPHGLTPALSRIESYGLDVSTMHLKVDIGGKKKTQCGSE